MQFNVSKMLSKVLTCFHSFQTCQWEHYVSEGKMIILRVLLIILQIFCNGCYTILCSIFMNVTARYYRKIANCKRRM